MLFSTSMTKKPYIGLLMSLLVAGTSLPTTVLAQQSAAPSATETVASTTSSPTLSPTVETTAPAVAETTTPPTTTPSATATSEPCIVCGNETYVMVNPDGNVTLGEGVIVPCSVVFQDGLDGAIPQQSCRRVSEEVQAVCRCAPPGFTCSVCGDGFSVADPENNVTLPGQEGSTVTCGSLEGAGNSGQLVPSECEDLADLVDEACGCAAVGFNCSICGPGLVVTRPDLELTFQNVDEPVSCGDLEEAGLGGELTAGQCAALEAIAFIPCGCSPEGFSCSICGEDRVSLAPDVGITLGDVVVSCGAAEAAGLNGTLTATECSAVQLVADVACSCAPIGFTCSICGDGFGVTMSEGNITIPGQDPITCADAEDAGLGGDLTPTECAVLFPFALISCGCEEANTTSVPTDSPVASGAEDDVPTTSPEEDTGAAPVPTVMPTATSPSDPAEPPAGAPPTMPSSSPKLRLSIVSSASLLSGLVVAASLLM